MKGRVFKSTGSWYSVKSEDGNFYQSRLRGKFKIDVLNLTNPIAVGDVVEIELEADDKAIIVEIVKRENYIIRQSSRKKYFAHIIASNIDQAILIVTLREPRTSLGFIDRFLISAESFRIPVLIVINKTDLYREKDIKLTQHIQEEYSKLGYQIVLTSTKTSEGIEKLKELLSGKTNLVAGHSGVGKSSLMNVISPDLNLKTGEISKVHKKGMHTTTYAEMFEFENNTFIIDTPGMKEFGLEDMQKAELSHYFPEMRKLIGQCKFHNCLHINEPDCEVLEAVENGKILYSRYQTYLILLSEIEEKG